MNLEELKEYVERLEIATAKSEALLARAEKLKQDEMLAGKAEAGQIPPKPKEETAKEYKERVMKGG